MQVYVCIQAGQLGSIWAVSGGVQGASAPECFKVASVGQGLERKDVLVGKGSLKVAPVASELWREMVCLSAEVAST